MPYDLLQKWASWAATASIVLALAMVLGILVIQPRNINKWFLLSFSFMPLCASFKCLEAVWKHLQKSDAQSVGGLYMTGGVMTLAFVLMARHSLRMPLEKPPETDPAGTDTCTRHARWISVSGFAGFILAATGVFGLLKLALPPPGNSLPMPLTFLIFCAGPPALLIFGFPPRCPSCKTGRMRFKGSRPVWYRCQSCGHTVHTHIELGSRRNGSLD